MPDAPEPPEKPVLPEQDDLIATLAQTIATGPSPSLSRAPLVVGQRWRTYQIGDPLPCEVGWMFHAVNVGMLDDVVIRVLPIGPLTAMRAKTWDELSSFDHAGLLKGIGAYEEGEYRFEISLPPPTTTLKEWAACRQASIEDVDTLMKQLAVVLSALHDRGVVHLNLRPDTIYITTAEAGLHVAIGGLEIATVYNQPELVPIPVDPLYAPPETAG